MGKCVHGKFYRSANFHNGSFEYSSCLCVSACLWTDLVSAMVLKPREAEPLKRHGSAVEIEMKLAFKKGCVPTHKC